MPSCRRSPASSSRSRGAATPFWLAPPGCAAVAGQTLGTGDGATTDIRARRDLRRLYASRSREPPASARSISTAPPLPLSAGRSRAATPPAIAFATPPAAGVVVSADFGVLWLCRFADDALDLRGFMAMLFALGDGEAARRCGHDHAALLPDAPRPRLERSQEADVLDDRRAPRLGPRGARRALANIRSGSSSSRFDGLASDRVELSRPRRAIAAKPDGPVPAMPGAVRHVPLHRPDRQRGRRTRASRPATARRRPSPSRARSAAFSSRSAG